MEKRITWFRERLQEEIKANARAMRKNPTETERILWEQLRNRKLDGAKFRRQQPFKGFILDFYSEQYKLCIEVDGEIHREKEQSQYDSSRDEYLKEYGIRTLRFTNEQVKDNLNLVLHTIREHIRSSPHPFKDSLNA
jgi:very-short-patch-repair endonuclease